VPSNPGFMRKPFFEWVPRFRAASCCTQRGSCARRNLLCKRAYCLQVGFRKKGSITSDAASAVRFDGVLRDFLQETGNHGRAICAGDSERSALGSRTRNADLEFTVGCGSSSPASNCEIENKVEKRIQKVDGTRCQCHETSVSDHSGCDG
jgi:hypothetical protein